jgi:hypothetical protein
VEIAQPDDDQEYVTEYLLEQKQCFDQHKPPITKFQPTRDQLFPTRKTYKKIARWGVFDLETYVARNQTLIVYAAASCWYICESWTETYTTKNNKQRKVTQYKMVGADLENRGFQECKEDTVTGYVEFFDFKKSPVAQLLDAWVENKLDGYTFFAHFGGKFDSMFIIREIIKNTHVTVNEDERHPEGWLISNSLMRDGAYLSYDIQHYPSKIKITIKDSYKLLSMKLEKLATTFYSPITKQSVTNHRVLNQMILDGRFVEVEKEVKPYLRADNYSLLYSLYAFQQLCVNSTDIDWDPLTCVTLASFAKCLMKNYMNQQQLQFERNSKYQILPPLPKFFQVPRVLEEMLRPFYTGGYTDDFYHGVLKEWIGYYDANSMYPFMGSLPMPTGPYYWCSLETMTTLGAIEHKQNQQYLALWFTGFVKVRLTVDMFTYEQGQHLLWATVRCKNRGNVHPILDTPHEMWVSSEVFRIESHVNRKPRAHGFMYNLYNVEILEGVYSPLTDLLGNLFTDGFRRKDYYKHDNPPMSNVCKLVVNMQYGFLAINRFDREIEETKPVWLSKFLEHLADGKLLHYQYLENNYIFCKYESDLSMEDVNLCVAMHITNTASAYLCFVAHLFMQCNSRVLYGDTDSLMVSPKPDEKAERYQELQGYMGKNLGQWKNEWRGSAEETWSKMQKKNLEKQWTDAKEDEKKYLTDVLVQVAQQQLQVIHDVNYQEILKSLIRRDPVYWFDPVDNQKLGQYSMSLWHKDWMESHPAPIENTGFSEGVWCGPKCYGYVVFLFFACLLTSLVTIG